jgi:hypothetical protein
MSRLLRSCTALTASLLPILAYAQETRPASAPIEEGVNPFASSAMFVSPVWWAAVVLAGIVGYVILQKFLNK